MSNAPSSFVLGYITGKPDVSRVRVVAGNAMLIQGLIYALAAVALGIWTYISLTQLTDAGDWIYVFGGSAPVRTLGYHTPFGSRTVVIPAPSRSQVFNHLMEVTLARSMFLPAAISFVAAIPSLIFASAVRRGRRYACFISLAPVGISLLLSIFGGVWTGIIALMATAPVVSNELLPPAFLLFYLLFIALIALAGLCIDLMGFLTWISRQQPGEKPAKKFLG